MHDQHSYSIVSQADEEDPAFEMVMGGLVTKRDIAYQEDDYTVVVRTTDVGGLTFEETISIRLRGQARVELQADSNNDDQIDEDDDAVEEEQPGCLVTVDRSLHPDPSLLARINLHFEMGQGGTPADYAGWNVKISVQSVEGSGRLPARSGRGGAILQPSCPACQ